MLQVEATSEWGKSTGAGRGSGMRHVHVGALSAAANVHIFICIWRGVVVWLLLATCASGQPGKRRQAGKGRRIARGGGVVVRSAERGGGGGLIVLHARL